MCLYVGKLHIETYFSLPHVTNFYIIFISRQKIYFSDKTEVGRYIYMRWCTLSSIQKKKSTIICSSFTHTEQNKLVEYTRQPTGKQFQCNTKNNYTQKLSLLTIKYYNSKYNTYTCILFSQCIRATLFFLNTHTQIQEYIKHRNIPKKYIFRVCMYTIAQSH